MSLASFMILYLPKQTLRLEALPFGYRGARRANRLCTGFPVAGWPYCRRQLLAKAAIAASRVGSKPCVGERSR